jgi:protein required for attachment to host cells
MNIRIVVADETRVNFFDATTLNGRLFPQGSLHNSAAGLKDSDLESDREGRRFGGTAGHHHGVDGERSAERHALVVFAKEVAQSIEDARVHHEFDKLVLVAPPRMLGLLRSSLTESAQALVTAEVAKDVVHQGPNVLREVVPHEAFSQFGD